MAILPSLFNTKLEIIPIMVSMVSGFYKFTLFLYILKMRFRSFQAKALLKCYSISDELDVRYYFPSQASNFAVKAISYSSVGCNNLTGPQPYLFGLKIRRFDSDLYTVSGLNRPRVKFQISI
jgi:hypothetical protein